MLAGVCSYWLSSFNTCATLKEMLIIREVVGRGEGGYVGAL